MTQYLEFYRDKLNKNDLLDFSTSELTKLIQSLYD